MKETFESAGEKLKTILTSLENEDTTLDESLKLYAEAAKLIAFCSNTLNAAKLRVSEIDNNIKASEVKPDDGISTTV